MTPAPAGKRGPGRRPGESGTRQAILDAARAQFAAHGWDRATIRAIAREAGVDPALVLHFFGSKTFLFAAAMQWPFDTDAAVEEVLTGSARGWRRSSSRSGRTRSGARRSWSCCAPRRPTPRPPSCCARR
jgi:AcrR family transcriptional regulator